MSNLLELRDIAFSYEENTIFRNASFTLNSGDRVAVIGRNGSGKTTLLRLASGLLKPEQGVVMLNDSALAQFHRREIARLIGFVPQQFMVPFDFTVEQLVSQGRTPYVRALRSLCSEDHAAIGQAMFRTEIEHLRHRAFNQLSGGEQQRVKIAIALAQQPRLLLLDEPTQHLDIGRQAEVLELLGKLNSEGVTIVAAIHDLHAVQQAFPTVALVHEQSIIQGTASALLRPELLGPAFGVDPRQSLSFLHREEYLIPEGAHAERSR